MRIVMLAIVLVLGGLSTNAVMAEAEMPDPTPAPCPDDDLQDMCDKVPPCNEEDPEKCEG